MDLQHDQSVRRARNLHEMMEQDFSEQDNFASSCLLACFSASKSCSSLLKSLLTASLRAATNWDTPSLVIALLPFLDEDDDPFGLNDADA